jgi:CubicO group peptidase (beta-lactamase class C family)
MKIEYKWILRNLAFTLTKLNLKLLVCFIFLGSQAAKGQIQPASIQMDTLVNGLGNNLMKESKAVGLSIGVYHLGKTSFYNFGTSEIGGNEPTTKNSVYEIGSISKTFVSLLLAKAVNDHKINLQDDIRKYLDGKYYNLEYNHQPIRVLYLANTTSGLPNQLPYLPSFTGATADSVSIMTENFLKKLTKQDFFRFLHDVKLDTVPGYHPRHSNAAANLLGYILERVYNKPLNQLIYDYIISPLKMKNTSFASSSINTKQLVKGYDSSGSPMPYLACPYMQAAGGLRSSAEDMMKYAVYFLDNEEQSAQLSLQKTISISASTNNVVRLYPPDSVDATVYSISLNWFQYNPALGHEQIWTDGGTPGFCSYIVLYPEEKSAIILLSNKTGQKIFQELPDIAGQIFKSFSPN